MAQVEVQRQGRSGIVLAALFQQLRQTLAGNGLAHAVFAEQGEQRRGGVFLQTGELALGILDQAMRRDGLAVAQIHVAHTGPASFQVDGRARGGCGD